MFVHLCNYALHTTLEACKPLPYFFARRIILVGMCCQYMWVHTWRFDGCESGCGHESGYGHESGCGRESWSGHVWVWVWCSPLYTHLLSHSLCQCSCLLDTVKHVLPLYTPVHPCNYQHHISVVYDILHKSRSLYVSPHIR